MLPISRLIISRYGALMLFTSAERYRIEEAQPNSPALRVCMDNIKAKPQIDVCAPEWATNIDVMIAAGVVGASRRDSLTNPEMVEKCLLAYYPEEITTVRRGLR